MTATCCKAARAYWKMVSWDWERPLSISEALALVMLGGFMAVSGVHFQRELGELKTRSGIGNRIWSVAGPPSSSLGGDCDARLNGYLS